MGIEDYSSGSETYISSWYQQAKDRLVYAGEYLICIIVAIPIIFIVFLVCIMADFVDMIGNKVYGGKKGF